MSKKYYVVWQGAKPGIYDSWPKCQAQVAGRSDAQYMGFPSLEAAQKAYEAPYAKALKQRVQQKGGAPAATRSTAKSSGKSAQKSADKSKKAAAVSNYADINIYCDGACSPNPGKSGTGMAVYHKDKLAGLWYGLYDPQGTNNTAELNGILMAFKASMHYIKQNCSVQILSDSKYSIDCITKWAKGWKAKGWKKAGGDEIKNLELIQTLYQYYEMLQKDITITHVRGHADVEGNELSDRMAVYARITKEKEFVAYKETLDIETILAMESG